ncbi:MAG TPA: hypothetical protein PLQ45_10025, partial [Anaerohalosphaeraceae bacterium]|nr:hypothetical protein [Anaerohalosphaeraceae bacterium]
PYEFNTLQAKTVRRRVLTGLDLDIRFAFRVDNAQSELLKNPVFSMAENDSGKQIHSEFISNRLLI